MLVKNILRGDITERGIFLDESDEMVKRDIGVFHDDASSMRSSDLRADSDESWSSVISP